VGPKEGAGRGTVSECVVVSRKTAQTVVGKRYGGRCVDVLTGCDWRLMRWANLDAVTAQLVLGSGPA
jgi:hypothetical protein